METETINTMEMPQIENKPRGTAILNKRNKLVLKPKKEPKPIKVSEPAEPYARISWVCGTVGNERPRVEATGYIMDETEWYNLTKVPYGELFNYIRRDAERRKQALQEKAHARKIEAAKKVEDAARAKREALERGAKILLSSNEVSA